MCNLFNSDDFDSSKRYTIFDDFDIDFFPSWKPWFGAQRNFVITDKYRGKHTVKDWGKPLIWLCNADYNPMNSSKLRVGDRQWLQENCIFVTLIHKMFVE